MKTLLTMSAALALAGTSAVAQSGQNGKASVTVYIDYNASMATGTLAFAKNVARDMFASVGVNLKWDNGHTKSDEADSIFVDITSNTPDDFHRGALAYALPFEGIHIRVFYDRVERTGGQSMTSTLLAHVMVHEITHILQGLDHHSQEGVMKAHWTADDLARMAFNPLPFDPSDVVLIREGLARRSRGMENREPHRRIAKLQQDICANRKPSCE